MAYTYADTQRHTELLDRKKTLLANAKTVTQTAVDQHRELTSAEHKIVQKAMADANALEPDLLDLGRRASAAVLGQEPNWRTDDYGAPVTGLFSPSDAKGLVAAVKQRGLFRTEVPTKAALGIGGLNVPSSGTTTINGAYPSATYPLSQLFNVEATSAPTVRYYVLGGATAAVVAEAGAKPDSGVTVVPKDAPVEKIATTVRFSDELQDDVNFLLQFLALELTNACVTTENARIVAALAAASGIGTATGTTATVIDVAANVIASMTGLNGMPPDAFIVNPTVLAGIRTSKASTSGTYFVDPTADAPQNLHGVELVPSTAVTAGTAYMVGRAAATIFRRSEITAEIGFNADDWQTNQRTMRVEERLAVGVVRPSQVTKVTLT